MEGKDYTQRLDAQILLVEDNETDAELTISALGKYKLANRIKWVKDGAEALDFVFHEGAYINPHPAPKVILLDLRLPKVDGMEVLRRLKSDERTKAIPVVVLTSSKGEKDMVESYKLGVNSFINKPVEFEKFAKIVADLGYYWLFINSVPV
jgi:CheY-like chemotaxis protein